MVQPIVNAAPMTIFLGIQDDSTRALVPVPEAIPTHLPKVYTYAQTGPSDPQLVVGDSLTQTYGTASFDDQQPYYTHQSTIIEAVNAQGNQMMVQRLIPEDAAPPANARLWADVLPSTVVDYQRNSDGSIKTDPTTGDPVPVAGPGIAGNIVKWVVTHIDPADDGTDNFGAGTITNGDQTNSVSMTQSQRYPIMDFAYPFQGAAGNLVSVRLYAPTEVSTSPINSTTLVNNQAYPFRLQVLQKPDATSTAVIVPTQSAAQSIDFVLKPNTVDKQTSQALYATKQFPSSYQLMNSPAGLPNQYGAIGRFAVYQSNIDTLLALFYAAEVPFIDGFSDFTGAAGEMYLFNLFSGVSSQNVPYHSFQINTAPSNAQRLTENSMFAVSGGSDGTMNETLFAGLVSTAVLDYANPLTELLDTAYNPESIMYDSGFPTQTKYDMISFISQRTDTAIILSTHDVLAPQLTADQESSMAVALRTRLQQFPESDYFGTATVRGVIIGRSGTLLNSNYGKPLPLTVEFAAKCATYMGASNGSWKSGAAFDQAPANQVTMFADVNVTFTPASVRNTDWSNGLVWVEQYSRRTLYWPAFKTVYDNDTSVLTSFFTMMGCVELEKVGDRARRQYSGTSQLTNEQLIERINQFVLDNTNQRFDGRFTIIPDTFFTAADTARGYSWTLNIKIYANNMKTVQTLQITAFRSSDLTTTTAGATTTASSTVTA